MIKKERALAHIEKVEWIRTIEGADNIELIGILGWVVIAKIGEFKVGDLAVYIEIDNKCNETDERFEFLASKHYKIKTMKLGKLKCFSQGLALPLSLFPELSAKKIGDDVTKELKITYSSLDDIQRKSSTNKEDKYKAMANRKPQLFKKPLIRKIMKYKLGRMIMFILFGKKKDNSKEFPKWIVKTDESRVENCPFYLQSNDKWIKTEKLNGTSCTYAVNKTKKGYEFIVCSRNVRQIDRDQSCYHESNIYWELADKYNIKEVLINLAKLNGYNRVILQGEGIGNVQGNPYKLTDNKLRVFNLIIDGVRLSTIDMAKICEYANLKYVPIIDESYTLPNTMEKMKLEADGYSIINPKVKREGFVYRSLDGQKSFKNVSREYLLKHS